MTRKTPRWSLKDFETAKRLIAEGATEEQCQAALGRSLKACYERVRCGAAVAGPRNKIPVRVNVPEFVREEAKVRHLAPPRDISGAVFGDPPKGYSALERRS